MIGANARRGRLEYEVRSGAPLLRRLLPTTHGLVPKTMAGRDKRLDRMKADVIKALGHPTRLAIIESLRDGEKCVCDIAEAADAERSNVSRHLAMMQKSSIVTSRKEGLMVYYRLCMPCIHPFLRCVENILRVRLLENTSVLSRP